MAEIKDDKSEDANTARDLGVQQEEADAADVKDRAIIPEEPTSPVREYSATPIGQGYEKEELDMVEVMAIRKAAEERAAQEKASKEAQSPRKKNRSNSKERKSRRSARSPKSFRDCFI